MGKYCRFAIWKQSHDNYDQGVYHLALSCYKNGVLRLWLRFNMFSEWLLSPLKSHLKNANIVHIKQAPSSRCCSLSEVLIKSRYQYTHDITSTKPTFYQLVPRSLIRISCINAKFTIELISESRLLSWIFWVGCNSEVALVQRKPFCKFLVNGLGG